MAKKIVKNSKSNGNVFKTVVRGVVKEELKPIEKRLDKTEVLLEKLDEKIDGVEARLDEKIDNSFRKYRDDVLTGLDPIMGEIKAVREEQAAGSMLRGELEERVDGLESIHPQGQHPK